MRFKQSQTSSLTSRASENIMRSRMPKWVSIVKIIKHATNIVAAEITRERYTKRHQNSYVCLDEVLFIQLMRQELHFEDKETTPYHILCANLRTWWIFHDIRMAHPPSARCMTEVVSIRLPNSVLFTNKYTLVLVGPTVVFKSSR